MTKIVTVLSAPRSGSSALCRMIDTMGIRFGDESELVSASSHNRYGYYEKHEVLGINETLLSGNYRDDIWSMLDRLGVPDSKKKDITRNIFWSMPFKPLDRDTVLQEVLQSKMISAIQKLHSVNNGSAWKDARFCMTFPVWERFMETVPVILWRHPVQAAKSIENMTGIPYEYAEWIWAYYTKASFLVTKKYNPLIISHEEMTTAPDTVAESLSKYLIKNGMSAQLDVEAASSSIVSNQIHQRQNDHPKAKEVIELYEWLRDGSEEESPNLPPPMYDVSYIMMAGIAKNLFLINSGLEAQNQPLIDNLMASERKLDRIRKIPGYRLISSFLRMVGI